eukprot:ANDGO_04883.mRNA.1 hypothetical protein H310_13894
MTNHNGHVRFEDSVEPEPASSHVMVMASDGNSHNFSASETDRTCVFCLDSDPECDLIRPCKCRWAHRQCLDTWRTSQTYAPFVSRNRFSHCEVCGFEYKTEKPVPENGGLSPCALRTRMLGDVLLLLGGFHIPIIILMLIMARTDDGHPFLGNVFPESSPVWMLRYLSSFFIITVIVGFVTLCALAVYGCRGSSSSGGAAVTVCDTSDVSCCRGSSCDCGDCKCCDGGGGSGDGCAAILVVILVLLFIIGVIALLSFLFFVVADFAGKRKTKAIHDAGARCSRIIDISRSAEYANELPPGAGIQAQSMI